MKAFLDMVWAALNSPAGVTSMVSLLAYALNKLYLKKPLWAKFEGAIITGIKGAEKLIPDDAKNTALERFDACLKFVVKIYTEMNKGKAPTPKALHELSEGIRITHANLETAGVLPKKPAAWK